jgi:hypothetical protein
LDTLTKPGIGVALVAVIEYLFAPPVEATYGIEKLVSAVVTSAIVPTVIATGSTMKLSVLEHPFTVTCTVAVPLAKGVRTPVLWLMDAVLFPLLINQLVVPDAPVAVNATGIPPAHEERLPVIVGFGFTVTAVTPTQPLLSVKVRFAVPNDTGVNFICFVFPDIR